MPPEDDVAVVDAPEAPEAPAAPIEAEGPPADLDPAKLWKEVKDLRKESANYRTKAKSYEDAFSGLVDTDRDVVLDFARTLAADPTRAAEMAQGFVQALTPAEQRQVAAEVAKESQDTDTPLTKADVLAILQEQQTQAQVAQAQAQIDRDAAELGFPPGSRDYVALLFEAHNNQGDDLAKAAEVIKAERAAEKQHAIDEYLASKAGQAAGVGSPMPNGAPSGTLPTQPRTIEEASRRAHERFLADRALG